MASSDDLTPSDGLTNVWLEFYSLERQVGNNVWEAKFRFIERDGDDEHHLSTLKFEIPARDDGLPGMIARAHDKLILVLRQALYTSDILRNHYRKEAEQHALPQT